MRLRADQLSSTVAVLAKDFGFKEAVASHDAATMLSAATNIPSASAGTSSCSWTPMGTCSPRTPRTSCRMRTTVERLINSMTGGRDDVHLVVLGDHLYQLVVAPIKAPDTIAWMAMGFAVDDALVAHIRDLVDGTQVSVLAGEAARTGISWPPPCRPEQRAALAALARLRQRAARPRRTRPLGKQDYLTYAFRLGDTTESAVVVLQQPMDEVMAPYPFAAQCADGHRRHRPGRRPRHRAAAESRRDPAHRRAGARRAAHPGRHL